MLWVYVVDNSHLCCGAQIHTCCPQYIDVLHSIWYVVEHICRFCFVAHNIHPQYINSSTTYTHSICPSISCGCMLWTTTGICCGEHMLWRNRVLPIDCPTEGHSIMEAFIWLLTNCKHIFSWDLYLLQYVPYFRHEYPPWWPSPQIQKAGSCFWEPGPHSLIYFLMFVQMF